MAQDLLGRLNIFRKYSGLTDQEIGDLSGVSKQAVGKWGKSSKPSVDSLSGLKRECRLNPDWLLYNEGEMVLPKKTQFSQKMSELSGLLSDENQEIVVRLAEQLAERNRPQ